MTNLGGLYLLPVGYSHSRILFCLDQSTPSNTKHRKCLYNVTTKVAQTASLLMSITVTVGLLSGKEATVEAGVDEKV